MTTIGEMLAQGPLLTDGAWGTQLQANGLAMGDCPDVWNLTHPDAVRAVAAAYVDAGSRVVLTNTFRANAIALGDYGHADDLVRVNQHGVMLSREAAAGKAYVFASIGPSGKLLVMGDVSRDDLRRVFAQQAEALAGAAPDALLLETFSDLDEALIALDAAKSTGLPVVVSFAFDSGKQRDRTMTGLRPEDAARVMQEAGADAVGANCGNGMEAFPAVCARMRTASTLPLWMKANAGMPQMVDGRAVYVEEAVSFAAHLPGLLQAGASFVGGCCGTSPAFVAALAAVWREGACVSA
ncbi:MAG: homocysteine S-methyltransferase family protein [Bryobacterales bacterium]|jgi:methionine synthase I (cobalamin-dependent)|nr:homocysteine S-methyltransferase family protein [Bryobacterales bacterium]